jgi:hypothetical protein
MRNNLQAFFVDQIAADDASTVFSPFNPLQRFIQGPKNFGLATDHGGILFVCGGTEGPLDET